MSFLDIALQHAALGLYVFPVARDKSTLTGHGYKDASLDLEKIQVWWAQMPSANPGFAPGASNVAVLDVDYGLSDMASFIAWRDRNGIPATYTVRSGSRPEFKVHLYFRGAMPDVGTWELDGCSGQVKSLGGYVLAAGSEALHGAKHDKPGTPYEVIDGTLGIFANTPDVVRNLRKPVAVPSNNSKVPKTAWSLPVYAGQNRTGFMMEQTGAMRNLGCGKDAIRARMIELNEDPEIIADPVDDDRLDSTAANCAKFPVPDPGPMVTIGSKPEEKKITDWRELFHNRDAMLNAPPITFLIKNFLQREGVTAIAAPVRERKSLIALNVVHALLTGEKLFDHFDVVQKPSRVLYLCPEVSLGPFTDRLRKIGLMNYVGETLFCRTLSADGHLKLDDPALLPALPGSVVFLDTAVRFMEGDESSSQDARVFADSIFALLRGGAESVVMLHHSPKEGRDTMTLENSMRGSGDLGAFLACCWGTRLQDPQHPYESASYLENLKQRDFESTPFQVTCGPDCRMHIAGDPTTQPAKLQTRRGNKGNKDGKDKEAEAFIRANPSMSARDVEVQLAGLEIDRRKTWIAKTQARINAETGNRGVKIGEKVSAP